MKLKYILSLIIGAALLTSCEEKIEVDVPENTEKIVVEGAITTETDSSYVRLTKSVGYFDNTRSTPLVTNAVVTVNGISFNHVANGIYKPASPFTGTIGTVYNLNIAVDGKTYTSSSLLEPMFQVDTIVPVFKEAESFIDEGFTVKFIAIDNRTRTKYTYFRFGFKNLEDTKLQDSIFDTRVLFDNRNSIVNAPYEFELPFLRLEKGDSAILIFRSVDETVNRYYLALTNRDNGGGPFSTPPANLPTNIRGDEPAIGLFAAYDVKRYRVRIPD